MVTSLRTDGVRMNDVVSPVKTLRPNDLLHKCEPGGGFQEGVGADQGLKWIRFGILRLEEHQSFGSSSADQEIVLVVLGGRCSVSAGSHAWEEVGERKDVFSGPPVAVYIPPDTIYSVQAVTGSVEVAVCGVLGRPDRPAYDPRLISREEMVYESRGEQHWRRDITDVVGADDPADRAIIVEVMTPPGHWSSFPPHRHEVDDPPVEVSMEEIYYYRVSNPSGFGLQAVYTDDRSLDDAYTVRDHDVLVIPRGYHPVAAAPSTSLYYLCVLAGDRRLMAPRDEPGSEAFRATEQLLRRERPADFVSPTEGDR